MDFDGEHTMVMIREHEDGSQEWACPHCGRRLLIKWPPDHSRSVLQEGDPNAAHSGEIIIEPLPPLSTDESAQDDPYLAPFERWLEDKEE